MSITRRTFATLAVQSGVPLLELKYLLNHAASNVTMGYIHVGVGHLVPYQERASNYILGALGLAWTPGQWPPARSGAGSLTADQGADDRAGAAAQALAA